MNTTFTATFSHPSGWQTFDVVDFLVNNSLDGRNACYIAYSRLSNALYLVNDAGSSTLPGAPLNATFMSHTRIFLAHGQRPKAGAIL